jgi:ribosomal protein L40E
MTSIIYGIAGVLLLAGLGFLGFTLYRRRRAAIERAYQLAKERPLEVWVCRDCGFKSLTSAEDCFWCGAPKPEDPLCQSIPAKEFKAQLERPLPKRFDEVSDDVV